MKVIVIGAGWFGCHIAKVLSESGLNVTILEKEDRNLIKEKYKKLTDKKLDFLLEKYKAGYVVLYQETITQKNVIYSDNNFKIV